MIDHNSFPTGENSQEYPDTSDEWQDAGFTLFDVDEKTSKDKDAEPDFTDVGGTDPIADLDDPSDR